MYDKFELIVPKYIETFQRLDSWWSAVPPSRQEKIQRVVRAEIVAHTLMDETADPEGNEFVDPFIDGLSDIDDSILHSRPSI